MRHLGQEQHVPPDTSERASLQLAQCPAHPRLPEQSRTPKALAGSPHTSEHGALSVSGLRVGTCGYHDSIVVSRQHCPKPSDSAATTAPHHASHVWQFQGTTKGSTRRSTCLIALAASYTEPLAHLSIGVRSH